MTEKMTRRTFIKSAAAAAVVVSLSGMLSGCGEDKVLAEVALPSFKVRLKDVKVSGGNVYTDAGKESLETEAVFELIYTGTGFTGDSYANVFGAKVGETALDLKNGGMMSAADFPFSKTKTCTVRFGTESADVNTQFGRGEPLVLTVRLQGVTAKFTYDVNKTAKGEVVS